MNEVASHRGTRTVGALFREVLPPRCAPPPQPVERNPWPPIVIPLGFLLGVLGASAWLLMEVLQ